ncbi:MAG: hypothetical protein KGS44_15100 [Alphaproteobacteria bacterium]|jgi:hypothetical protein|nr:hypothetical protein [Alphaproteobacteria bacterium]
MDTVRLTPEEQAARRKRSRAIAVMLLAFMALVFGVTLANLRNGAQLPSMRWEGVETP